MKLVVNLDDDTDKFDIKWLGICWNNEKEKKKNFVEHKVKNAETLNSNCM